MSDGTDLLVSLIRDALTGKPIKLGFMETPKLLSAISELKNDPTGRVAVFEEAVRACAVADPMLRNRLRIIVRELDAETGRITREGRP